MRVSEMRAASTTAMGACAVAQRRSISADDDSTRDECYQIRKRSGQRSNGCNAVTLARGGQRGGGGSSLTAPPVFSPLQIRVGPPNVTGLDGSMLARSSKCLAVFEK